jgi:hypothetical protein
VHKGYALHLLKINRFRINQVHMVTQTKWILLAIVFCLFAPGLNGQDQQAQNEAAILNVNDLATKPAEHLGQIQLLGVVAAVSQGTGFVLVDKREYAECGISCISEPGTKKIPVRWSGDAPKLEQTVRVDGTLRQTDKGLSLVAQEVRAL